MKNQKGSTPFFILILIGIVVLLISAGSYYYLRYTGKFASPVYSAPKTTQKVEQVDEVGVSNSDDMSTIESELDETDIGSIEDDLEEILSDILEL